MAHKPKTKKRTPARAAASRANGAKGGRKRDKLPEDVVKRLGTPPVEGGSKALRLWNAKLLAEVQWLAVNGLISSELAATLRANAGSIDRALPPEPKHPDDDEPDADDDDEETPGPDLTPIGGEDEGLRVG